jgi:hypothetical protein
LKFAQQIAGGLPSIVRIFRQAGRNDAIEGSRSEWLHRSEARRRVPKDGGENARMTRALERLPPGHHLINDCPEGEDVSAGIDGPALDLFRRHVLHRAENCPAVREMRVRSQPRRVTQRDGRARLREPEV